MAWCDDQFRRFNENLKLDSTRRGRIDSAVTAFIDFCRADEQLAAVMSETPFLQGSVATNTATKPIASDEFDVDVIYPFRLSGFNIASPTPGQIIDWFISRLKIKTFYAERLIRKHRCARINYAGDFHLDIIPATKSVPAHQPYAVPARDLGDWTTTDPKGFAAWVAGLDARGGGADTSGDGRFVRGVRMMKRWRDHFFGDDSAPSSILLVTMLGNHEPCGSYTPPLDSPVYLSHRRDAAYIYDMLRITHGCLKDPRPESFVNPTIRTEDLSRGWHEEHLELFLQRLESCIDNLSCGILASTEGDAVTYYKKAFGDSFPT